MLLILVALTMFGVPMLILDGNRNEINAVIEAPTGIWVFDVLINQYLLALGEFNKDQFELGPQTGLCFIFFSLATFIT